MAGAIAEQVQIAFGKAVQSDIATANSAGELWSFGSVTRAPFPLGYGTEDDTDEDGKVNEFPTQQFKVSKGGAHTLEFKLSSEIFAWASVMGLGKTVKSGAGPYVYTSTPMVRETDGCELPYFTVLQKILSALDQAVVGVSVAGWTLRLGSGPGSANATLSVDLIASGREAEPSGISFPASKVTPNRLLSASLALTANGIDYVTAKRINSLELSWTNAPVARIYPGAGVQDGYAVAGTLEYTKGRGYALSMDVDFNDYADELLKIKNLTEGTAVLTLGSGSETFTVTCQRMSFAEASWGENERGGLSLGLTARGLWHASNGLLTVAATTATDGIAGL